MKVKEYVNRFYAGIAACDEKTVKAMAEALILESNAEFGTLREIDEKRNNQILWKFNNKGNVIADAMNAIYHQENPGVDIVRKDWFRAVTDFEKPDEAKKAQAQKKKERRKSNAKKRGSEHKKDFDAITKSEKEKMVEEVSSWE